MAEPHTDPVVNRPLIVASVGVLAAMLVLSLWAYARLPADALVPTHWGIDGQVDDYMGKFPGLFLPVGMFALVFGLLLLIPKLEPRKANLARSATAFRATVYAAITFFAALHVLIVATALGYRVAVGRAIPIAVGALLVVLGNWLPKVRSNFMFGIRTPWTLTSDYTWRKVHRVGGRVFVVFGLVAMVAGALVPTAAVSFVLGAGAAVLALGLVVYSYAVWRAAPDRRTRDETG